MDAWKLSLIAAAMMVQRDFEQLAFMLVLNLCSGTLLRILSAVVLFVSFHCLPCSIFFEMNTFRSKTGAASSGLMARKNTEKVI